MPFSDIERATALFMIIVILKVSFFMFSLFGLKLLFPFEALHLQDNVSSFQEIIIIIKTLSSERGSMLLFNSLTFMWLLRTVFQLLDTKIPLIATFTFL